MAKAMLRKFVILLVSLVLSSFISKANALQYYTRGPKSKQHPHSQNRYTPHLPAHLARQKARQKVPCKQHGRALCLGPKAPDFSDFYTRSDRNGVYVKSTHPLIRKVIPPKIHRVK